MWHDTDLKLNHFMCYK